MTPTYFNRFDILNAYFHYASDYHGGQGTALYRVLSRCIKLCQRYPTMSENAEAIYWNLVEKGWQG